MLNIILSDLVPIFVIMILGYLSGKFKAFSGENARSFNKFVLNYALPASLFVSIVQGDRKMLFSDLRLLLVSIIVIVGLYFWSFFSCRKFFKHTKAEAAICGLIGGAPTVGFLGYAVLGPIYGSTTSTGLVVAIVAIVVNAFAIPIGLLLLNSSGAKAVTEAKPAVEAKPAMAATSVTEATSTTASSMPASSMNEKSSTVTDSKSATTATPTAKTKKTHNAFVNAIIEPVVWAPILAVILVLIGVKFPAEVYPSFNLIGKANSGVAVFAAGLTLSANKFEFDWEVIYNSIVKLILMPVLILIVGRLVGMSGEKLQMLVLAGALPPVFSGIIIGSRYQTYVRTGTSSLAVSTLFFMGTAPLWIWLARIFAG